MYIQTLDYSGNIRQDQIKLLPDNAFIPFDLANTDYQKFKKDVLEGIELQDADGNAMTQEEAVAFINELP